MRLVATSVLVSLLAAAGARAGSPEAEEHSGYRARAGHLHRPRPLHKVLLDSSDESTYARLRERRAVRDEIDYGSFKLLVLDEDAVGGADALRSLPLIRRDGQDQIALNGYVLDTTRPEDTYLSLPDGLGLGAGGRGPEAARADAPKRGL